MSKKAFETAFSLLKNEDDEGYQRFQRDVADVVNHNHPMNQEFITNRGGKGQYSYATSDDTHHYFVQSKFDALSNWFLEHGMVHNVVKIPHEDWNTYLEEGQWPRDLSKPSDQQYPTYFTGLTGDTLQEALDLAHAEKDYEG